MVEMRGVEPLSENPSVRLSSWAVCYLAFPAGGANRHAPSLGSPFVPDRFKGEKPMQVHHSSHALTKVVVPFGRTGGPQAAAPLIQHPKALKSGGQSNSVVVVCFEVWAVIEFARLATLIVRQDPRRNHCTPMGVLLLYTTCCRLSTTFAKKVKNAYRLPIKRRRRGP